MKDEIRRAVREVYDGVGTAGSHAPRGLAAATGRDLALALGYPAQELDSLPPRVLDAFVGVAPLPPEVTGPATGWVIDLGCGAGTDASILAGRGFRVAALDASLPMLKRLQGQALSPLLPVAGELPTLPFRPSCASWILLNGVANTLPARRRLLGEVRRVLRPGGTLLVADLIQIGPLPEEIRSAPEAWAWCVAGADTAATWRLDLAEEGFDEVTLAVLEEISPLARAVIRARRPGSASEGRDGP